MSESVTTTQLLEEISRQRAHIKDLQKLVTELAERAATEREECDRLREAILTIGIRVEYGAQTGYVHKAICDAVGVEHHTSLVDEFAEYVTATEVMFKDRAALQEAEG